MLSCMRIEEVQTNVRLQINTYVFNNNIEKLAPFNRLYGASRWLHLINYLEPLVTPNSRLNGATLSPGWLQITYPIQNFWLHSRQTYTPAT